MSYIVYGETYRTEHLRFFTLNDLLDLCNKYPNHKFTLVGTEYSLDKVKSWRGSYAIPSMTPTLEKRLGSDIAKEISEKDGSEMRGYKGGNYLIDIHDEFYISQYGCCEEYKITGYELSEYDYAVILITNIDEY